MVDNASIDGSTEKVKAGYPEVTVLEPLANLGSRRLQPRHR